VHGTTSKEWGVQCTLLNDVQILVKEESWTRKTVPLLAEENLALLMQERAAD
jgi:hypothetical protein